MTVSATRTRELSIDQVITTAMQLSGLMDATTSTADPVYTARVSMAMNMLDVICKRVQNVANIARHQTLLTANITTSNATVTLSANTSNALGPCMYYKTGANNGTPVALITLDAYQAIVDKTSIGTPTLAYFDRQPTPLLKLWPVPDATGTITINTHILAADVSLGTETVDFERAWTDYFVWELGHYLKLSSGGAANEVRYLADTAATKLREATAYSRPNTGVTMRLRHPTAWSC